MKSFSAVDDYPIYQIIAEDGSIQNELPEISDEKLRDLYKWMRLTRLFDQRMFNLQRQGRIGTYAPFNGQEAAQIGSFALLDNQDWISTSYREIAGLLYHGMTMQEAILYFKGHPDGGKMPENLNIFPIQIIIAAQMLHAVGAAWASKLKGEKSIAATYFGDGATSQGDFHEALNFASVFKVPVVFFCQNNQWAISVPFAKQMATPTVAQKAIAYGMEGIRVDGNDILAVYAVMQRAVERARTGEGPTLIEAVTYRVGFHTTSDDPSRYRNEAELKEWQEKRDPLLRFRTFLQNKGLWNEAEETHTQEHMKQMIEEAVQGAEAYAKPQPSAVFDHVYETLTDQLTRQKDEFVQHLKAKEVR